MATRGETTMTTQEIGQRGQPEAGFATERQARRWIADHEQEG
jgi:hypothetical protein